jgi:hypothetical protein
MQCPVCAGVDFQVDTPGVLRCTSQVLVNAVPSGMSGNLSPQPVPVYGPCGNLAPEREWQAATQRAELLARESEAERKREDACRARKAREQFDLEDRQNELLAKLREVGNPGQVERCVPGAYRLSLLDRVFGRLGSDAPVPVEPAWPIGTFTWMQVGSHGVEDFQDLATGFTATGRFVPIEYATVGDEVEVLYRRRSMPAAGLYPGRVIHRPTVREVVVALERAFASAS